MTMRTGAIYAVTLLGFSAMSGALGVSGCGSDDSESKGKNNTPDAGDAGTDSGDAGGEAAVDAGKTGAPPGSACWVDADCKDGVCWTPKEDGFPGGYCVIENCTANSCPSGSTCVAFDDGVERCVPSCASDSDCRLGEGYVCEPPKNICWPGVGTIAPGGSCGADVQCMGSEAICILQTGFIGGYCVIPDCTDSSCPAGSECRPIFTSGGSGCIAVYADDKGCRPGYQWVTDAESKWFHACYPGCDADPDCPGDYGCRDAGKGLICVDVSNECSPKNQQGDCPDGLVCNAGACAPFVCNDTVLEPNQSLGAAAKLPASDTPGLQICSGDDDWFSFTPAADKTLYLVGIDSNHASGNLQVDRTDAAGAALNDATMRSDYYHSEGSVGPTNLEVHSLLGVPGSPAHYFHVHGVYGSQNNYGIVSRGLKYEDGPDCTAVFGVAECVAQNAQGNHDPSKLVVFPDGNPLDPYLGAGVFFKNGLSAFGNPPYTSTSRLWARREVIMAMRFAIHSVQQAFPGTNPLSIGDISMPDGTTPEGHPNGTHYEGANVDVAYYIRPDVQGTDGNLAYRQICCDAVLKDWSCVDTSTSSPQYGTCKAGSEATHIVDLPRTALFIAKLASTGRIRVIGTEAKVAPALETAMSELQTQGKLTAIEAAGGKAVIVTADDDGSWIWHFNHLHVSFKTDPSSSLGGQTGLWPNLPKADQAARAKEFWVSRAH